MKDSVYQKYILFYCAYWSFKICLQKYYLECKSRFLWWFCLLAKTEGNVIASGYRNARGYGYVSLFNMRFTWLFSKITETYIVKQWILFFFQSKCYILGIIYSLIRLSKLILSDFFSQMCRNLNCSIYIVFCKEYVILLECFIKGHKFSFFKSL